MIRLNLATDYALRTLLYLAARPERRTSVPEIAAFYRISADHVSKVVQHLGRAGYVRAARGRGGGLRLARAPGAITVGEIVELFEGPVALLDCITAADICVLQPYCRLRRLLDEVGRRLLEALARVTIADLVEPGSPALVPLEGMPAVAPDASR